MTAKEKAPSAPEGLFTCADLHWRATAALLSKSTARILALEQERQRGSEPPATRLMFGDNSMTGFLSHTTLEDNHGRPSNTVRGGHFRVTDSHYLGVGDHHPYGRSRDAYERHRLLAQGVAALHISVNVPGFLRHYDIFHPNQLEPGERLHATIYPVDLNEQQYHLPKNWPEGQPLLYRVSGGTSGEVIPDPSQHANLSRVYAALGSTVLEVLYVY